MALQLCEFGDSNATTDVCGCRRYLNTFAMACPCALGVVLASLARDQFAKGLYDVKFCMVWLFWFEFGYCFAFCPRLRETMPAESGSTEANLKSHQAPRLLLLESTCEREG